MKRFIKSLLFIFTIFLILTRTSITGIAESYHVSNGIVLQDSTAVLKLGGYLGKEEVPDLPDTSGSTDETVKKGSDPYDSHFILPNTGEKSSVLFQSLGMISMLTSLVALLWYKKKVEAVNIFLDKLEELSS
ncbi:LPXTG cell wall anchor domain-containing protein [Listeria innocua]|uniref:LPXTG cell wall anchor domain-containing protein n=1 Tax=Listeria innocua TaxID=1642 RepID=UPI00162855CE|nr:LPXTG cell wall anchor domain-containing protein [Listeria innocua]MBC1925527.1 LPXTG cell wall anchor domain-containing protein [Listeria innocua]